MDKIIEVIAYGRNSDKAQTTSQDIQDDAFTHFAANAFATLFGGKAKIVENYKDHGKSASKKRQLHKRHDFHRMLDDVRAGTIRGSDRPFPKIILVLNTSRFSRLHELDTLALYNVLRENDVKLVSIDDRKVYDFDGFAQIIDLLVKAKEDKEYSRKIAQNVLRGHVWTTRLGRCHQRFSPYGMMKLVVTDTKEEMLIARQRSFNKPKDWQSYLIPGDPLEQDVVRAIFQLFKERDVSYTEMGRLFSTHANLKYRLGPTGNGWHETTMKHILGNLHYAGYEFIGQETSGEHFRFNGEDVVDAKEFTHNNPLIVDVTAPGIGHPKQGAVVDRKLFWEVQDKRKRKAVRKSKPKSTDLNPEGYTLGGGVLVCGNCGKPMYGHHNQGRGNLYTCKGAKQGRCGYWSVKEEEVLPWLLTAIDREVWRQREDKPAVPEEVDAGDSLKDDIAKLERKITMLRGKVNAADDADVVDNLTDLMTIAIKQKKELEAQTVQTDRRVRLLAAQERWELFVEPMLVGIKTGIVGHDSQEVLEAMGIEQSDIDRLFNFTMVRPSVVRETLLSYKAEVKLWFSEKKQSSRANGGRKSWEVDMGRLDARIGSLQLTPINPLAAEGGRVIWDGDSFVHPVNERLNQDRVLFGMYGTTPFLELPERVESIQTYNFKPETIRYPQKPAPGWFLERDGRNLASVIETTREIEDWAIERAGRYLLTITKTAEFAGVGRAGGYETLRLLCRWEVTDSRPRWNFPPPACRTAPCGSSPPW